MPPIRYFHHLLSQQSKRYYVRGTSSNVGGTETFSIAFINDGNSTVTSETITCDVDTNGNWEFSYNDKKIYSLEGFAGKSSTLLSVDFSKAEGSKIVRTSRFISSGLFLGAFWDCVNLKTADLSGLTFESLTECSMMFAFCSRLETIRWSNNLNLDKLSNNSAASYGIFDSCARLQDIGDWSNQTFKSIVNTNRMFYGCTALDGVDFSSATFEKLTNAASMFYNCTSLTDLDFSSATFEKLTNASGMFRGCTTLSNVDFGPLSFETITSTSTMFNNCTALDDLDLSSATFKNLTDASSMFNGCAALTGLDLSSATFENLTNANGMFGNTTSLSSVVFKQGIKLDKVTDCRGLFKNATSLVNLSGLESATFENVVYAYGMFRAVPLTVLSLPEATFENATQMGVYDSPRGNAVIAYMTNLQTLDWPKATLQKAIYIRDMFMGCSSLTTINVPQLSTAIANNSPVTDGSLTLDSCPLTYDSMLKVANWVSDLTGYTQHTVTFNQTAWGNLTTEQQVTISNILIAKNWACNAVRAQ